MTVQHTCSQATGSTAGDTSLATVAHHSRSPVIMQSSWCLRQASCSCRAASRSLQASRQHLAAARCPAPPGAAASCSPSSSCQHTTNSHSRWQSMCGCSTSSSSPSSTDPAAEAGPSSSSSGGNSESSIINYAPSKMGSWVINKQPINASMTPELYAYMLNLTKEHPVLAALREETASRHGSQMQVSPEQGQFMAVLVKLLGVKNAIEVGVFTGYSSVAVAMALPPHGHLVACDRDAKTMEVARRYWQLAGVTDKVDARLGPGLDSLQQLLQERGPGSFDFAFIDADKGGYQAYFELCLQLVRPGGCIAVDNVLFYGRVIDPERNDRATVAIRSFNEALAQDDRVEYSIVPIGDGVALCRVL